MRAVAFTRNGHGSAQLDGVQVERRRPRWVVSNTPVDPAMPRELERDLEDWRPDILVAHTPVPFPAEVAARAARRAGIPYVVTYHAGRLEGGSPLLDAMAAVDRATAQRRMLAEATRLIAVSPFVRDRALRRWRARCHVIPPGVDARRFQPAPPSGERSVLLVAPLDRAYRWKGVDVLWQAMRRVRAEVPDATLTLVGTGDRLAEFADRARREGVTSRVRLPGRVAPEALVQEYQRAAVAALPSTSEAESFGMVLAEANACARPVVASNIGGIPGFVRDGDNGLLAQPGDPRSLADALVRVLRDPALAERLGQQGRVRVVADHDWDKLAARTERVLLDASQAPGRAPLARAA